jgi:hypothetical protein
MNQAIQDVARVLKLDSVFIGNVFVGDVWDDTYTQPDPNNEEYWVTKEGVGMTLVKADSLTSMFTKSGFSFTAAPTIDVKEENTGLRGVYRFCVVKDKDGPCYE